LRSSVSEDRHEVDRFAPLEQLEHRPVDVRVGLAVEVLGPEELGDLDDRFAVDKDRTEHGLLGFEALWWQAIDHGAAGLQLGSLIVPWGRRRGGQRTGR